MNAVVKSWKTSKLEVFFATLAIAMMVLTVITVPVGEKVDAFYMISSGDYILDNHCFQHIMSEAPFKIDIVVQNWLVCLVYAIAYRIGIAIGVGWWGVVFVHTLSVVFFFWTIWQLGKQLSKHRIIRWFCICLSCLLIAYTSANRAHTFTYALQLWCLYFTYQLVIGGNRKISALMISLIYILYMNVQAGLIMVLFCYGIAVFGSTKSLLKHLDILGIHSLGLGLSVLLNPYHFDALLYPLRLFVDNELTDNVVELTNLIIYSGVHKWAVFVHVLLVFSILFLVCFCILRIRYNLCNFWLLLCYAVIIVATFFTMRLVSICCVYTIFLWFIWFDAIVDFACDNYGVSSIGELIGSCYLYKWSVLFFGVSVFLFLATGGLVAYACSRWTDISVSPDCVLGNSSSSLYYEIEPESTVFCYNGGSRLAMLGHKVSMTTRWETWNCPSPWSDNYAQDFMDTMKTGKFVGSMDNINWDYILMDISMEDCIAGIRGNTISDKYKYEEIDSDDVFVLFKRID